MRVLAVLGASGHGKVVADAALCAGWDEVIFFDDAWPRIKSIGIWPVMGTTEQLIENVGEFEAAIIAIGDNAIRQAKSVVLHAAGVVFATVIHPRSIISTYAQIGLGSVVFAGAVLNAYSVVGEHCIVNTNATVEHDCVLADAVHISPGSNLAGQVCVGSRTWIGLGSNVRQLIHIGSDVIVGAGSVVVKNVPSQSIVWGTPAKNILEREGNRA
jgi:sugar O-acyltransferase (sialic acid O-acetyltransferase NeuD family)|tara:strand:- start:64309 stop:64950 length:642 start_codon:yes stop_codon:yes gene_type:complete